jgi:chromosome partitioning protein
MSIPVIAFFNNKGGVGKTSTVYHLAWMLSDCGCRVVAADLDPQCNLTASFLDEDRLEQVMSNDGNALTVFGAVRPLKKGTGDMLEPHLETISDRLGLVLGDMALSTFEDDLSEVWPKCMAGEERAFRITSAFWRLLQAAGRKHEADVILLDLGPNLGAINRAALIASDFVVIPLGPDLFSLQGLKNLGPPLRVWRDRWQKQIRENPLPELSLPPGGILPIGYMVLRHSIRLDRPVKAFERWLAKMPSTYAKAVLQCEPVANATVDTDPNCIAKLRDYRSLMPLAQESRKPMFFLKAADGAMGAHTYAVAEAYKDFKIVAGRIADRAGIKAFAQAVPDASIAP